MPDIDLVMRSRVKSLVGVYWTPESVQNELLSSKSLACFGGGELQSFVLYKEIGAVLEILLIFSRWASNRAGDVVLQRLIDSCGHPSEVWLEVHEDNQSAIQLYERHGFKKVGLRSRYYPDGKSAVNYSLVISG
ncbi:MAG: GNAT family N-acetyltransferase [Bdellovibrionaceae bacterium]|nr:GNAT family N-acetyltransferase [Pseudobdellovibrionaceae bacterium]